MSHQNSFESYDEVEYPSLPVREADPLHMATVANLFGLDVADPATCDVLDIGCGDGGNLISLATAYPGIRTVGYDPAKVAIDRGRAIVERTGLTNVQLHHDASEVSLEESADYVIAHGVLSWVPEDVRDLVIAQCASAVRPGGLVNFSFRALPYTYVERAGRDMAYFAIEVEKERAAERGETLTWRDEVRIARERVALAAAASATAVPYGAVMGILHTKYQNTPEWGIYHDDLSDPMHAFRLTQVVELAAAHGLTYVGEVIPQDLWQLRLEEIAPQIRELGGPSAARRRQVADDLVGGGFHSSLFVKSDTAPQLEPSFAGRPLYARRHADDVEKGESRSDAISAPVAQVLREHHPEPVLATQIAEELGRPFEKVEYELLKLHAFGLARITTHPPTIPQPAGARPRIVPLVADQIRQGEEFVVGRLHRAYTLEFSARRVAFLLCDGVRDHFSIRADLPAAAAEFGLTDDLDNVIANLPAILEGGAEIGLLEPPAEG